MYAYVCLGVKMHAIPILHHDVWYWFCYTCFNQLYSDDKKTLIKTN